MRSQSIALKLAVKAAAIIGMSTCVPFARPQTLLPLIPYPAELKTGGDLSLSHGAVVRLEGSDPNDRVTASDLESFFKQRAISTGCAAHNCVSIVLVRATTKNGQ